MSISYDELCEIVYNSYPEYKLPIKTEKQKSPHKNIIENKKSLPVKQISKTELKPKKLKFDNYLFSKVNLV